MFLRPIPGQAEPSSSTSFNTPMESAASGELMWRSNHTLDPDKVSPPRIIGGAHALWLP
jgi:hypothetical protein